VLLLLLLLLLPANLASSPATNSAPAWHGVSQHRQVQAAPDAPTTTTTTTTSQTIHAARVVVAKASSCCCCSWHAVHACGAALPGALLVGSWSVIFILCNSRCSSAAAAAKLDLLES
jgi:hypothetical protein